MNYLPIFLFAFGVMAVLLFTDAKVMHKVKRYKLNPAALSFGGFYKISISRIVLIAIVIHLVTYIWIYQKLQSNIYNNLIKNQIEKVDVGSLSIPWSAFYKSLRGVAYEVDAGFSKSRKRTRSEILISGNFFNLQVSFDEQDISKIRKIAGREFVFSYLTDVNILRPEIIKYMNQLVADAEIIKFDIENFDNRGPYILVVLNEKERGQERLAADNLATKIYKYLTAAANLQVRQVVVKIVEAQPYLADKTIRLLARGTAAAE